MADIAARVPLGSALRRLLADLRPRGVISQLRRGWEGPLDCARALSRQGPARRPLARGARPRRRPTRSAGPACAMRSLQLEASEGGGQARIDMQDGGARSARRVRGAAGRARPARRQLTWQIEAGGARRRAEGDASRSTSASFANADAKGDLTATWRSGPGSGVGRGGRYPGRLELDGKLIDGVAARTARYLPLGLAAGRAQLRRRRRARRARSRARRSASTATCGTSRSTRPAVARDGDFRIAARSRTSHASPTCPPPAERRVAGVAAPGRALHRSVDAASSSSIARRWRSATRGPSVGDVAWSGIQRQDPRARQPAARSTSRARRAARSPTCCASSTSRRSARWIGKALAGASATGTAELKLAPRHSADAAGRDGRQGQPSCSPATTFA